MKIQQRPFALIIFGPTGVGKTDFSLEVARHIPAEIINGDTGQFYTPLSIGTAKPDWKNEPIPHHLFDIVDEPKNITVWEYRSRLLEVVANIWSRKKLPIIVGGSGFYLKSIFFPPCAGAVSSGASEAADGDLWKQLNRIDPKRAAEIKPGDTYRLRRALAIWYETGRKPSECAPVYDSPIDSFLLYISRDRGELYKRINERTFLMVRHGWLEETLQLQGTAWEPFLYEKKIIGYDVLLDYLNGKRREPRLQEAIKVIQQRTRNYAKRQRTFWNSFEQRLNDAVAAHSRADHYGCAQLINLTLSDRDLYIKQVLKRLRVHIG